MVNMRTFKIDNMHENVQSKILYSGSNLSSFYSYWGCASKEIHRQTDYHSLSIRIIEDANESHSKVGILIQSANDNLTNVQ